MSKSRRCARTAARSPPRTTSSGRWCSAAVRALTCCSVTTSPTRGDCGASTAPRIPRTRSTITSWPARDTVNPEQVGTKAAFHHRLTVAGGETAELRLRLAPEARDVAAGWEATLAARSAGGGRVLRRDRAGQGLARDRRGDAPGLRRDALGQADLPLRRRHVARRRPGRADAARKPARQVATRAGVTSTTSTSSRCPTSGSTPGTRPGTSRSTASRSRRSTPSSPRAS